MWEGREAARRLVRPACRRKMQTAPWQTAVHVLHECLRTCITEALARCISGLCARHAGGCGAACIGTALAAIRSCVVGHARAAAPGVACREGQGALEWGVSSHQRPRRKQVKALAQCPLVPCGTGVRSPAAQAHWPLTHDRPRVALQLVVAQQVAVLRRELSRMQVLVVLHQVLPVGQPHL